MLQVEEQAATVTPTYVYSGLYYYCNGNWAEEHAAHTIEDSADDCKEKCSQSSSCAAITYGVETGGYANRCVLCASTSTSKFVHSNAIWETYLKTDYSYSGLYYYCDGNWAEEHAAHTIEDSADDCKAKCSQSSSCAAITYGVETGGYANRCVLCASTSTSKFVHSNAIWETYTKNANSLLQSSRREANTIHDSKATTADYVYGDIGVKSCPTGYETIIGDEATCITASTYLGDPYKTNENPDDITTAYCNGRACGDAYNQGTGCENTRMTTSSGTVAQYVCKLACVPQATVEGQYCHGFTKIATQITLAACNAAILADSDCTGYGQFAYGDGAKAENWGSCGCVKNNCENGYGPNSEFKMYETCSR
jgi:hypothetical protein